MFPLAQILLCALVAAAGAAVVLYLTGRTGGSVSRRDVLSLAAVVGLSTVVWRSAANVGALNDDPMPWVSPNDLLSPAITYVALDLYASLTAVRGRREWPRSRALLTLVALAANVLAI